MLGGCLRGYIQGEGQEVKKPRMLSIGFQRRSRIWFC